MEEVILKLRPESTKGQRKEEKGKKKKKHIWGGWREFATITMEKYQYDEKIKEGFRRDDRGSQAPLRATPSFRPPAGAHQAPVLYRPCSISKQSKECCLQEVSILAGERETIEMKYDR